MLSNSRPFHGLNLEYALDSVYRIWVGIQFGETLGMKEKNKMKFAFLQLPMPSFLQTTHVPSTNTPILSISQFRREGKVGSAGKNRTLKLKMYSPSLHQS